MSFVVKLMIKSLTTDEVCRYSPRYYISGNGGGIPSLYMESMTTFGSISEFIPEKESISQKRLSDPVEKKGKEGRKDSCILIQKLSSGLVPL